MMGLMNEHILEEPTAGVLTMQSVHKDKGYRAGYERVGRLMRKACTNIGIIRESTGSNPL